jgi:23S rRNA (uracil1939-C5)-methyltransferase
MNLRNDNPIRNREDIADPPCPHFGPCGGCQLQHLTYAAQLRDKAAQLRGLLEATGIALPELQIHPSPPLAYRNRIRLTLAEVDGQLRAGYIRSLADHGAECPTASPEHTERSGCSDGGLEGDEILNSVPIPSGISFLPIRECPIAAPILWRATEAFLASINEQPRLWLRNPRQMPDQLELFTTADESRLQLTLFLRTTAMTLPKKLAADFTALCEALRARITELAGAGISLLPAHSTQRSRRAEQPRPGPTWGSPGLNYSISVPQPSTNNQQPATFYWVPRGAFFQVNRFLLPELLALVTANRTGGLAFDLYAGVGLFSRALATQFAQVAAVEIAEPAFTALAATKLTNLRAVKATTLDFLRVAVLDRDRPEFVVLDPPRSGAGPEVCTLLARIAAPTLVYVSCSPETLPADLKTLTASGYTLTKLHLFDLFPQTTHIETVAVLTC